MERATRPSCEADGCAPITALRDKMRHELPEGAASTTALELALEELASLQPLIDLVRELRRGPPAARGVDPKSEDSGRTQT